VSGAARIAALACALITVTVAGTVQPPRPAPAARPAGGHPAQRVPAAADFPTGPALGERLPDFRLPNQRGEWVDFHADRAGRKAAVVFQRSAVW
jgi:hypothetical protein